MSSGKARRALCCYSSNYEENVEQYEMWAADNLNFKLIYNTVEVSGTSYSYLPTPTSCMYTDDYSIPLTIRNQKSPKNKT